MTAKSFSMEELIAALEKNGLKQTRKLFFKFDENNNIIAACAIGQIASNLMSDPFIIVNQIKELFPEVYLSCPSKGKCYQRDYLGDTRGVTNLIFHLNDSHRWTFRSIAKWLRSLSQ
jgi:hypothetical protein